MGFLDKVRGLLGGHKDQANEGIDKAAGVVDDKTDDKTGGSHSDQITSASEKTKDPIDNLGDEA